MRAKFKRSTGGTREFAAVAHFVGCSNVSRAGDGGHFLDARGDVEKAFTAWSEHAAVRRANAAFFALYFSPPSLTRPCVRWCHRFGIRATRYVATRRWKMRVQVNE